jgi:hypothetical protein
MPTTRTTQTIEVWASSGTTTIEAPAAFTPGGLAVRTVTIMEPRDKILIGGSGEAGTEIREIHVVADGAPQPPGGTYAGIVWCPTLGAARHVWVL